MTLQVTEQLEARLTALAQARKAEPSALASDLLTHALDAESAPSKSQPTAEDLLLGFQKLAEKATAVTAYPSDFFSRDVIYADHD